MAPLKQAISRRISTNRFHPVPIYLLLVLFGVLETGLAQDVEKPVPIYPACDSNSSVRLRTVCTDCIPPNYEKSTPPPKLNGTRSRLINFQFHLLDVKDVNVKSMEITMNGYLRLYWAELRLTPTCMHANQSFLNIDVSNANKLWVPDVYVVGVKRIESPTLLTKPASLRLYNDGILRYSQYVSITTSCSMNFRNFPMDTQRCRVQFESYGYTTEDVYYEWKTPGLTYDQFSIGQFEIVLKPLPPTTNAYDGYAGAFPMVDFEILLTRRLSHYLFQAFLPSILLILMSWASYVIPVSLLPGRMLLCVATILSASTQFSGAQTHLPQVSYMKAIDIWMLACLTFETISLLELCFVVLLKFGTDGMAVAPSDQKPQEKANPPIKAQQQQINDALCKDVLLGTCTIAPVISTLRTERATGHNGTESKNEETRKMGIFSRIRQNVSNPRSIDALMLKLFPLAFAVFNIVFWTYYLILADENERN